MKLTDAKAPRHYDHSIAKVVDAGGLCLARSDPVTAVD